MRAKLRHYPDFGPIRTYMECRRSGRRVRKRRCRRGLPNMRPRLRRCALPSDLVSVDAAAG
jgi:hypothetical protein